MKALLVALLISAAGDMPPTTAPKVEAIPGPIAAQVLTYEGPAFVVGRVEDAILAYCYKLEDLEKILKLDESDHDEAFKLFRSTAGCYTGMVRVNSKRVLRTVMMRGEKLYLTEMTLLGGWAGPLLFPNAPETIYAITPYSTALAPAGRGRSS